MTNTVIVSTERPILTINTGIQGPPGIQGPAGASAVLEVTDSVANEAALPAAASHEDEFWLVEDTGVIWFSNGSTWIETSIGSGTGGVESFEGRTGAVVATAGDYTASEITNTPAGTISAITVQAALNELDTEKSPTSHTHSYEPIDATILRQADIDDTPVNGVATAPISSNWAYDHTNNTGAHLAANVTVDASGFNGNLESTDNTVQKVAQKLDNLILGSGSGGISDGDTLTTGLTFPNTGLHILDTNASHYLILSPGTDLTAGRTLTITTGDADRTLAIGASASVSGSNTGDQDLSGYSLINHTHTGTYDPAGTAASTVLPGGRPTLSSGVPLPSSDTTSSTTVYYTPYRHNQVPLWDGSAWQSVTFTETSIAVGTVTSGLPYDLFGYLSSGSLALELTAWTDSLTRASAVSYQDGRICKTSDKTRILLGTVLPNSTTTIADTVVWRGVSSAYWQSPRNMEYLSGDTGHATTTVGYAPYAGNTAHSMRLVTFGPTTILGTVSGLQSSASTSARAQTAMGLNSTSSGASGMAVAGSVSNLTANSTGAGAVALAPGGHTLYLLERLTSADTGTFSFGGLRAIVFQ